MVFSGSLSKTMDSTSGDTDFEELILNLNDESSTLMENMEHKCVECDKTYSTNSNLLRHVRLRHCKVTATPFDGPACTLCMEECTSKTQYEEHLKVHHDVDLEKECMKFSSRAEFEIWKEKEEKEKNCSFVKHSGIRHVNDRKIAYFYCHRSGQFRSRSKGKRRLKMQGSNKINGLCPSMIKVTQRSTRVNVEYVKTHVGHSCDIDRLHLTEEKKKPTVIKLANEIPITSVLDETCTTNKFTNQHYIVNGTMYSTSEGVTDLVELIQNLNSEPPTLVEKVKHKCAECDKTYARKANLLKHVQLHHCEFKTTPHDCPTCILCMKEFISKEQYERHLKVHHNVDLKRVCMRFSSKEEFEIWKEKEETEENCSFVKHKESQCVNDYKITYFYCDRNRDKNKRHLKIRGSNKINGSCPSMIKVKQGMSHVDIEYVKTHVGHSCDIDRLCLTEEKKATAIVLANEIPITSVLDDIRKSITDKLKGGHLLTCDDLLNIKTDFNNHIDGILATLNPEVSDYGTEHAENREFSCYLLS